MGRVVNWFPLDNGSLKCWKILKKKFVSRIGVEIFFDDGETLPVFELNLQSFEGTADIQLTEILIPDIYVWDIYVPGHPGPPTYRSLDIQVFGQPCHQKSMLLTFRRPGNYRSKWSKMVKMEIIVKLVKIAIMVTMDEKVDMAEMVNIVKMVKVMVKIGIC